MIAVLKGRESTPTPALTLTYCLVWYGRGIFRVGLGRVPYTARSNVT